MDTVLIVEENRQLSNLYSHIITKAGFRVIQAYSSASALHYLKNERPMLVLLDTALSDGSSSLVSNYLQSHSEFDKTCVDIISGDVCYKSQITFQRLLKFLGSRTSIVTFPLWQ